MEGGTTGPVHFLNLEYFFRLLYESRLAFLGEGIEPGTALANFLLWIQHVWGVLGLVSFIFSLVAFVILAYSTVRLQQLREAEEHARWSDLDPVVEEKRKDHSRWAHIQSLIESAQESDWRQAIIEADIMLEEVLRQAGYPGTTVGDRLKVARFESIQDAWEAHGIRNDIAHQGSAYHVDDNIAYRTIKKYEKVFKEFGEI